MLADLNLDDENFNDLVEDARNLIASEYPEWTDFNYHDPGITLTELFVFFKEIAQYRINYAGEAHQKKYLKLLGIEPGIMQPAKAKIRLDSKKTLQLPAMTRFYASDICFESTVSKYVVAEDIRGCVYTVDGNPVFVDRKRLLFTRSWKIPVFGKTPEPGACFYLMFGEELPARKALSVFAEICHDYEIKRNPIKDRRESGAKDFEPLAEIAMEYYTDGGWRRCAAFEDGTWGFLQSGWLEFTLDVPMMPVTVAGHSGYFVRYVLTKADYDVPPMLQSAGMNYLEVRQERHYAVCQDLLCEQREKTSVCRLEANEVTVQNLSVLTEENGFYRICENYKLERCENLLELTLYADRDGKLPGKIRVLSWENAFDAVQVIGEGEGLPFQEYELDGMAPVAESFVLMTGEPDDENLLGQWQQVPDFAASGPSDRHYILDTKHSKIIFGDCIRGMAPEGKILIVNCAVSEGAGGNVKAEKIRTVEEGYEALAVTNEENASGGQDAQTMEQCFLTARQSPYKNTGLVTSEDYEAAVRHVPGLMIENCCVLHPAADKNKDAGARLLTIAVRPFSFEKNPKLSEPYMKNIMAALDGRRMIGTKIQLVSPEYVKMNVFVECRGSTSYLNDRERILGALKDYFKPFSTRFGGQISCSEVYELLDRLDAVETMETLAIDVTGSSVGRTSGGDIILPPNGLVSPGDIQYNISIN